tara:strand:+ start:53 stop:346 length:294 start_codon:yes stop_codon:yes gene_type:complete
MAGIINLKVDVTKLSKDKLFVGKKGTYANITIAELKDGENEYGDTHYAFESQSKEEREAGAEKVYVGNGKEFVFGGATANTSTPDLTMATADEDLPF